MPPEISRLLRDMLDASDAIMRYTQGSTKESFAADEQLQGAVNWKFVIIGEALSQLRSTKFDPESKISEWERIIRFRNQLIHGYRVIQPEITWSIINEKLPILRRQLDDLLA